jgi:hypothetical protein
MAVPEGVPKEIVAEGLLKTIWTAPVRVRVEPTAIEPLRDAVMTSVPGVPKFVDDAATPADATGLPEVGRKQVRS